MVSVMERVRFSVGKNVLLPASAEANAVMSRLKIGETVAVEIYRPRDNTFAARVNFAFEAVAKALNHRVRNVRGWIAAQTGRADTVTIAGRTSLVAWGTGPRDMGSDELELFWSDAIEVIESDILPTLPQADADAIRKLLW